MPSDDQAQQAPSPEPSQSAKEQQKVKDAPLPASAGGSSDLADGQASTKLSEEASEQIRRFHQEIRDAVDLLEFAIKNGRTLDDGTVERIKKAEGYLQRAAFWPLDPDRADFEKAYRDLAIFMKPVTVETLRATTDGYAGPSRTRLTRYSSASDAKLFSRKLWLWVIFSALVVVLLQTFSEVWVGDEETSNFKFAYLLLFLKPLHPFFYGLFGALASLLRSAHGYIADNTFDMKRLPEYYNRMLLGFISGGIVLLFVTDPTKFGVGQGAISFMVGYNTDYLFDMIERVANGIFPKVNLTVTPKDVPPSKPGIAKVQVDSSAKTLTPSGRGNATVTLTAAAPAEGVPVALTAAPAAAINLQTTVIVAAGATSAQFAFSVSANAPKGTASITASANGSSASDSIVVS